MSTLNDRYPEIVYQDVQLGNSSNSPQPIQKSVNRYAAILQDPSKYAVAIVRLILPCNSIWNWQPELLLGQASSPPIQTIYRCVMSYNGTDGPVTYQELIRSRLDETEPTLPLAAQPTNAYAAVYSQATVVNMLNNWLLEAFNGLKTALGGSFPGAPTQPQAPYYTFDSASGIMTLNGYPSVVYDTTNPGAPAVELWFGAEWLGYLDGYNIRISSTTPTPAAKDVQLVMSQTAGLFLDSVAGPPVTWLAPPGSTSNVSQPRDDATALLQCPQDYATPWVFDRALSSIIVSSSLPTLLEAADPPVAQLNQTTDLLSSILMDFATDTSGSLSASTSPLLYTAPSVIPGARYTVMSGSSPLRSFTITASWMDSFGIIRPLLASSSQSASIKLAFVRRDLLGSQISLW